MTRSLTRRPSMARFNVSGAESHKATRQKTLSKMSASTKEAIERRSMLGMGRVRKIPVPSKKPDIGWIPLTDFETPNEKQPTWDEVRAMNHKRKWLLHLARETSPIDTVTRLSLLPRTVFPRLIKHTLFWCVMGTFALTAVLARMSFTGDHLASANEVLEGGGTFVAFMIIFYVGYCCALSSMPPN